MVLKQPLSLLQVLLDEFMRAVQEERRALGEEEAERRFITTEKLGSAFPDEDVQLCSYSEMVGLDEFLL